MGQASARRSIVLAAVFGAGVAAVAPAAADPVVLDAPHLMLSPTVGVWRWDEEALLGGGLEDGAALVYGGRAGYAPIEALTGEIVVLTGTNRILVGEDSYEARLTQIELSFSVKFRALFNARWYPFVDLGAGAALRSSDATSRGVKVFDGSHIAFHLGGGIMVDLATPVSLRLNLRDTFYTETKEIGGTDTQSTHDAVEISLGLDYRIPLSSRGRPERLR
jgi:hypothetical protein